MPRPQVRIDPIVAQHLLDEYANRSLSAAANLALRDRYGLDGRGYDDELEEQPEPAVVPAGAPAVQPAQQHVQIRPGRPVRAQGLGCRHPPGWRVGNRCGACGQPV